MERYCVKCGKITTKRNESCYACEAGHENWINPAAAVSVFVIKGDKVLYGIRSHDPGKGKLDRPGGFIEVGETAEQAAIRETREELGIDIALIDFLGSYATTYQNRPNLNFVFVAQIENGVLTPGDGMEEVIWLGPEELPGPDDAAAEWFQVVQKDFLVWWQSHQA